MNAPVCAHCRQGITSRFLRVGRYVYHPEHFLCAQCQRPIVGTFNVHAGAFLHPACFAAHHAPKCHVCAQPLAAKYVVFEGHKLHEACYAKHHAVTCAVCRDAIVGTSLTDAWGHVYHAEHAKVIATCLYCGKLCHEAIGGGGLVYGDGRAICRGCHRTAVHRDADAHRTVAAVRAKMQAWGVDLGDIEVPVRMVDRTQLARLLGRSHAGVKMVSGLASMQSERTGRVITHKRATIHLLAGMPQQWLEATAAHELMHVWNFYKGPAHTFELEEGACNYMSYRVHLEKGDDVMAAYYIAQLMKDPHPAYGVGFRRVKRYVDRHGFGRLLTLLGRSRDFPLLDGLF